MKASNVAARSASPSRAALAAHLVHLAESQSKADVPPTEQSAAIAKRDELVADVLFEEELPRRIRAYQAQVLQVNAAWNDVLAFDDVMRRRYPRKASAFNTAGPHERAVLAPSTDRSPLPPLKIDSRALFGAARTATEQFVDALGVNAEARFGKS
jgi:hypothetical protein